MLHTNFKSSVLKTLTLIVVCLTTFSFASKAGGDRYEIFLNDKLIMQKYITQSAVDLRSLQLDKTNYNDKLVIYYSHCGTVGKGRSIVVKDDQGKILKEWKFSDAANTDASMSVPVKDILELQKSKDHKGLTLYYFSSQYLPKGRMLTSISLKDKNLAWHKTENDKYWPVAIAGVLGFAATGLMFRLK